MTIVNGPGANMCDNSQKSKEKLKGKNMYN